MEAVTVFLDTAIFMYAAGAEHPFREPCRVVLARAGPRRDRRDHVGGSHPGAHPSISVDQARPTQPTESARDVLGAFGPVLAVDHAVVSRLPDLLARYPALATRDLVHVATCIEEGIGEIVTPDRGFDAVREIRRVDPVTLAA